MPQTITILIVDHNKDIIKVLEIILTKLKLKVLVEQNPFNVLSNTDRLDVVDLIIVDENLPRMNGAELTRQLKMQYPKIKIIFTSSLMPSRKECESIPADAFLQKPYKREILLNEINNIVGTNIAF